MAQKQLNTLFEEFISESQYVRLRRPATIHAYRQSFATFQRLTPGVSLQLLNSQTLTCFFQTLQERKRVVGRGEIRSGIKRSTLASYWNKLSAFFSWLEEKRYVVVNPLRKMRCPTPSYEDRKFLEKSQIQKILSAIHDHSGNVLLFRRNLAIFYLLLFCGLRKEELVYSKIQDFDFTKQVLTVRAETSKSGKSRQIPLHSAVIFHLKQYLEQRKTFTTPYLIVSSQRDDRLSYDGLKHLVEKLKRSSEVKFHLHQFRHTFAVNFLKVSKDLSKLKQLLGHSDIKMTSIYLRNLPIDEIRTDIETMSIQGMM